MRSLTKLEFVGVVNSNFRCEGGKSYDSRNKVRRYITERRGDTEKFRNSSK